MNEPERFRDPDAPLEVRIDDLLRRLTREEKTSLMRYDSPAIDRLGIPAYNWWNECLHGVARNGRATIFPQAIGLAATFDPSFVGRVAQAISDEARAKYHAAQRRGRAGIQYQGLTFWSPNVNIFRDPRWGRGQETYGEDPFLTGEIGVAFVAGLQGDDERYLKVSACAKHFAVHSGPERLRHEFDAVVSTKNLRETYLPAFRRLVEADVDAVMGAYNRTNGEVCCGSHLLLEQILREEWGFAGHVVSDCWAVQDFHEHHHVTKTPTESAALAVSRGCDLNCGCTFTHLNAALDDGLIDEAAIDRSVRRLLRTRFRLGQFDSNDRVPYASIGEEIIDGPAHRALAREAARRSIVLLKNDGLLPLAKDIPTLYVGGPLAGDIESLIGNYYGSNPQMVTLLEGVIGAVDGASRVTYRRGVELSAASRNPIDWARGEAGSSDVIIAAVGLTQLIEGEEGDAIASDSFGDRDRIELPEHQVAFLRTLAETGKPLITVVFAGSPVAMPEVHDFSAAVIQAWYPGEEGGNALADVIFGDVAPTGKLPVTVPRATEDLPPFEDYRMKGRTYRYSRVEPLYPFGFGLSYGAVSLRDLELPDSIAGTEDLCGTVTLHHTSGGEVEETVQVYVTHHVEGVELPRYSLVSVERARVAPGQSARVSFTVPADRLRYVGAEGEFRSPAGSSITVHVGCASPDPRAIVLGAPEPVIRTVGVRS